MSLVATYCIATSLACRRNGQVVGGSRSPTERTSCQVGRGVHTSSLVTDRSAQQWLFIESRGPFNRHRLKSSGNLCSPEIFWFANLLTCKCIVSKGQAEDVFDKTKTRCVSTFVEFDNRSAYNRQGITMKLMIG